jgi:hypothetical protein
MAGEWPIPAHAAGFSGATRNVKARGAATQYDRRPFGAEQGEFRSQYLMLALVGTISESRRRMPRE